MNEQTSSDAVERWRRSRRLLGSGVVLRDLGQFTGVYVRGELRALWADRGDAELDAREWVRAIKGQL